MLITVKILLGILLTDYSKDQVLNTYCEIMSNKVKAYCNITTVPPALKDVVAEMVAVLYRKQYGSGESTQMVTTQAGALIKKETVGDHTIEYTTDSSSTSSTNITQDIINDHKMQLNPYRRVKFV
jgi:hypothetical protein